MRFIALRASALCSLWLGVCSLLLFPACQPGSLAQDQAPAAFTEADRQEILSAMAAQETCWNQADIPCFMAYYWQSDSLTFTGSNGINQGWQATYDRYVRSYPDAATMGQLTFGVLQLNPLAPDVVQLIGKWDLRREMGDIGGYFTLLWRKIDGQWRIIADHTS